MTDLLDRAAGAEDDEPGGADAFTVLGLPYSTDLDDEDVRRAYLIRLRAVHPDNGGDAAAAAAVTAAYDALRSGVRRGELLAAATVDRGSRPSQRKPGQGQAGRGGAGPGVVPDAARRAELRARVAASRAAQGLPPFVTDEATLSKIADLLIAMRLGAGARVKHYPRSLSSASPGWDAPWWDEDTGRAALPREPSSWRMARRRRRAQERELAEVARAAAPVEAMGSWLRRGWMRVRYGRPAWFAARVLVAAFVPLVAQYAVPGDPVVPALAVGAFTWLVLTARLDLAPMGQRQPDREAR